MIKPRLAADACIVQDPKGEEHVGGRLLFIVVLFSHSSLPEFMDFILFGKTILVVNKKLGLFLANQLRKQDSNQEMRICWLFTYVPPFQHSCKQTRGLSPKESTPKPVFRILGGWIVFCHVRQVISVTPSTRATFGWTSMPGTHKGGGGRATLQEGGVAGCSASVKAALGKRGQ